MFSYRKLYCLLYLLFWMLSTASASTALSGENVLVLYKQSDQQSRQIADYYSQKRHIPESQLVGVDVGNAETLSESEFERINQQLKKHLKPNIKVLVLAWHTPYRVECMSITSAFTLGFDKKYCSARLPFIPSCHATAVSPFYNATKERLWQSNALRLSIMLSGTNFQQAKAVIDRGVAADSSKPAGEGYLLRTSDAARSTRWSTFEQFVRFWPQKQGVKFYYIDERHQTRGETLIKNRKNTLFYFTGAVQVPYIKTNIYLPGAIADHLTSYGGAGINENGQMKVYRWLEAGVTGSYGTVVEPCNYPAKFSDPQILIPSYMDGDTLIEAYWKSVQQPGEGIFVGEPLACPWCDD